MTRSATGPRIRIDVLVDEADRRAELYDATFWSLRRSPKELLPAWLYDELGSRLFDEITTLPEYYPTRREREILAEHAGEIAAHSGARTLIELGAGSAEKTVLLLDALRSAGTLERFVPLDISEAALRESARAIGARYPTIGVNGIVGDFQRHLGALPTDDRRLVAFLGSTLGNLYPPERARMLEALAAAMGPADTLLLGVDLVKEPARLEAAYNDGRGITERFVRNALEVANRRLGAGFEQRRFAFGAFWDGAHERMDLGVRALEPHGVPIADLDTELAFEASEWLRVEISTKFRPGALETELTAAGLRLVDWWTDRAGDFGLFLARR